VSLGKQHSYFPQEHRNQNLSVIFHCKRSSDVPLSQDKLKPRGFDEIVKDDFAALRQMLQRAYSEARS